MNEKNIPKLKQIALLEKIVQLSSAGIHQKTSQNNLASMGMALKKPLVKRAC